MVRRNGKGKEGERKGVVPIYLSSIPRKEVGI